MDDKIPRHKWKYGRISKLIDNTSDGLIRGVFVVVNSNGRLIEMRRPVNRLIPVEMRVEDSVLKVAPLKVVSDVGHVERNVVDKVVPLKFVSDKDVGHVLERNVVDKLADDVVPLKFVSDKDVSDVIKVFDDLFVILICFVVLLQNVVCCF